MGRAMISARTVAGVVMLSFGVLYSFGQDIQRGLPATQAAQSRKEPYQPATRPWTRVVLDKEAFAASEPAAVLSFERGTVQAIDRAGLRKPGKIDGDLWVRPNLAIAGIPHRVYEKIHNGKETRIAPVDSAEFDKLTAVPEDTEWLSVLPTQYRHVGGTFMATSSSGRAFKVRIEASADLSVTLGYCEILPAEGLGLGSEWGTIFLDPVTPKHGRKSRFFVSLDSGTAVEVPNQAREGYKLEADLAVGNDATLWGLGKQEYGMPHVGDDCLVAPWPARELVTMDTVPVGVTLARDLPSHEIFEGEGLIARSSSGKYYKVIVEQLGVGVILRYCRIKEGAKLPQETLVKPADHAGSLKPPAASKSSLRPWTKLIIDERMFLARRSWALVSLDRCTARAYPSDKGASGRNIDEDFKVMTTEPDVVGLPSQTDGMKHVGKETRIALVSPAEFEKLTAVPEDVQWRSDLPGLAQKKGTTLIATSSSGRAYKVRLESVRTYMMTLGYCEILPAKGLGLGKEWRTIVAEPALLGDAEKAFVSLDRGQVIKFPSGDTEGYKIEADLVVNPGESMISGLASEEFKMPHVGQDTVVALWPEKEILKLASVPSDVPWAKELPSKKIEERKGFLLKSSSGKIYKVIVEQLSKYAVTLRYCEIAATAQ